MFKQDKVISNPVKEKTNQQMAHNKFKDTLCQYN